MAGLPTVTFEGRVGGEPELRFTPAGVAVCSFSMVMQDRKKNEASGEWEDNGDPLWVRISAWRQLAENVAESVNKGDLVVVTGKLNNRKWEDKEGVVRTSLEVTAWVVAASLQFRSKPHSKGETSRPPAVDDPWNNAGASTEEAPPF